MKKFKKILTILPILFLFACGYCANENNLEILTLLSSKAKSQNRVWIGTFQLVFNDMKNNIIKHDIEFVNEKSTKDLMGLNAQEFNSDMLNPESYYKSYGETSPSARDKIKQEIKEKFDTTSDVIDNFDWTQAKGKYYAYAMLKKEFEFYNSFDELDKRPFNNSAKEYKFFGIKDDSKSTLDDNVGVLFYNNPNDYAVTLYTKNNDIVYLYRTNSNKDFRTLFETLNKQKDKYTGQTTFSKVDTLLVPEIKFNKMKSYKELCNKIIKDTDSMYFSDALETIEFVLDKKGGKVKSEAILMSKCMAMPGVIKTPEPRHFNFDKTFVLFLIDKNQTQPYMALRINNLDNLQ